MAYATIQQLDDALGYTPNGAQGLLDRASRDVDRALFCSVYDTDEDGNPTDAAHVTALTEATVEQVAYQLEQGNTSGIPHGMQPGVPQGSSAGSVDLSRGQSVGGSTGGLPRLGEQAWIVLQIAGLVPAGPRST
ncbi:hypothetical protein [Streptomyces sp.]|uniref:hypothetical protein n=1 Tax=Streptomyces sp. TaxID=1931 RepID=UPI002F95DF1F